MSTTASPKYILVWNTAWHCELFKIPIDRFTKEDTDALDGYDTKISDGYPTIVREFRDGHFQEFIVPRENWVTPATRKNTIKRQVHFWCKY
jgi:hypothetical protein